MEGKVIYFQYYSNLVEKYQTGIFLITGLFIY